VVIVSSGREEMEDDRSNYINTTGMETQLSTGALLGGRVDRLFAPPPGHEGVGLLSLHLKRVTLPGLMSLK
jgi:hypothetical protein